ncbi:TlpA family protein disulfide reductase [bacterium]|nr:TlpA family protein disulfide reductase [bacterium]
MKRVILTALVLISLVATTASAQDRAELIKQLRTLSAAPGSEDATRFPPDGRPWIVFIFKACCTPAEQAAKDIVEACDKYGDRIGVLGLNVDRPRTLQRLPTWLHMRQIDFAVLSDPTGQVARSWGVIAPPAIVVLDTLGREVFRTMGYHPLYRDRLYEAVDTFLRCP